MGTSGDEGDRTVVRAQNGEHIESKGKKKNDAGYIAA
jgi:hypothetical protein